MNDTCFLYDGKSRITGSSQIPRLYVQEKDSTKPPTHLLFIVCLNAQFILDAPVHNANLPFLCRLFPCAKLAPYLIWPPGYIPTRFPQSSSE
ncbi:hypothetical protein EYC84_000474 [Monilinia fructicola]|uniref:Uncharacterized protein n=1 Tax=Monilinia fructicola TaxID=38448 RepID=A0A5M9JST7_MONFR|nr:hypothetical protein EYC84_000474 [Monilinia fructicola]